MAPFDKKRKTGPTNDSFMRSKKASESDDRPSKRPRAEEKEGTSASTTKLPPATKISRLKEEEVAFPRGGASVLTPLEHKQIQIDATRDVLFEQYGAKSSRPDGEVQEGEDTSKVKKRGKGKGKSKKKAEDTDVEEDTVKIEGLSYKRLVPGSLVLGQVSQINATDIALSLPNNLTGYVPITSISDKATERIEAIAAAQEDDAEDELEAQDIELKEMFSMGQYLRAYVVSTSDETNTATLGKGKRRIELSLRPQHANNAVTPQNLITNTTLMASVTSVEDHGLIMNIGLEDSGVRGFMGAKDIGHEVVLSDVQEGAVFLCMVTGLSSNGKTVKLCADTQKIGNLKKSNYLTDAPTVDAFLPGTAVEILIVDVSSRGVTGKVMGMVDVTADLMHSGTGVMNQELEKKFKIGAKVRGRVICTFPNSDPQKLGVSLLDHVASLSPQQAGKPGNKVDPLDALPLSAIIEEVAIKKVESGVGLFVDVGVKGIPGFVHISRVKDGKIETLEETTGPYKVGSVHRGRVLAYNSLDGVYLVSLEKSVLEQPYLRIEDLKVSEVVKGKVEKLIVNANGVGGLLVNLAENISGLVPETHLADVQLLHPEKKFKEGMSVTARVLSTDPGKRQIRLTLKKTLVNSESPAFISYDGITVGMQSPGTIVNIMNTGAVVQFYGNIRGFLPVSEMSEAYIQDPSQHFKVGQVVNVHVLKVDPESQKLTVSCKDPSVFGLAQQNALKNLKIGEILSALVIEKSNDDISVEIQGLGLKATLPVGHLTDGSENKSRSSFKNIRVGQVLTDLAVLDKHEQRRLIVLTNKPALVKAARYKTLLRLFDDVKKDRTVHGFIKNITLTAVFVQFGGGLTGLLPKNMIPEKNLRLPDFGFKKWQTVEVKVIKIDNGLRRFLLSLADATSDKKPQESLAPGTNQDAVNPVDETIKSIDDITLGRLTKARVSSVKDTQVNVQLADNIQGRIDVSQAFDSWPEIKSKKQPLKSFSPKQIINVRVLGIHDARNHRFLPISHRSGKTLVFELSAKPSDQTEAAQDPVSLDRIKLGSSWLAFVNNVGADCLWVNLSPNVRGRISALDVSDDVSLIKDLEANFPIGSAIRVHVKGVDVETNRLDLSARSSQDSDTLTFDRLSKGMIVPGKVTRVNERQVMVQITDSISAPINLTDLCDDFSEADPSRYSKNDIVRVCVTDLDIPNKRVRLSTRASRVINSSAAVQDVEISSISQLKVNDIVRGFVKHVADKGLFVNLGGNVTAYVRISDLSDSYIKDWKSEFQVDQLVKGKVTVVDEVLNHIQLSLKPSVIDKDYIAPLTFNDIHVDQIITGKIRKVEDFGVFIVIDGSANVSGLCHQSEMAEKRVHDIKKLYSEGDEVKAIVLKMDPEKKRISFSMKASHFEDGEESAGSEDDGVEGVKLDNMDLDDNDDESEGGVEFDDVQDFESTAEDADEASDSDEEMQDVGDDVSALSAGGFDWSADILDQADGQSNADSEECIEEKPKKKKRKAEIKIDRTGDLDANGPQSVSDFERLLLGRPDSSSLWTQYMAFQMQLSELGKAREIAERAIKTINMREETEKLNIWLALLNLEIAYGNDETVEEVFKRACQYNDAQEVHERLASIYIQSGKNEKADELFQTLTKKFSQSPTVWVNYAHFLFNTLGSPDRGRALLPRATQSLPPHTHLPLTLKFAALEFRSEHGSPERGRTIFEGVLAKWNKRLDIWGQLLDLETKAGDAAIVRGVFERVARIKGLKPKGAKGWFKRWSEWEEANGDKKSQEKVRAIAEEWVRSKSEKKDDQD
ncbi:cfe07548-51c7-45c8-8d6d-b8eec6fe4037 [Sclerotinia trifoliorum]|uniref:rRNA biogenesis protein RRP5 n=1 Tax=Sclerotinia trifoliorum TaxID=28548 RepID=A0A8H2VTH7_9HELO|nr:cfe07548-51c7-45c8-8d6d-b8eec6fe4037 [Sclerotinia trifoliorum]